MLKSKHVFHISKSVETSTRLAHFYPSQNKYKTKIFTLERNQQKLPHHKEQSIFGTLKETSIKTVRRSRDRIKGSINHKIRAPFRAVYLEKKCLTLRSLSIVKCLPAASEQPKGASPICPALV